MASFRERLDEAIDPGQLREGAKSTGKDRWVSCSGFGNLTPTASLILAPHGGFAQQGWLCGARAVEIGDFGLRNAAARHVLDPLTRSSHY